MDWEPGARGTVIAGRYRASGELRRRGMIEATDLEAPPQRAACRLIGVPGDPQTVDAWQRAWADAEVAARLPSLRAVVRDDESDAWAVLDPPRGVPGRALPVDARKQALAMGAALARAGLDAGDVAASALEVGPDGALLIDGVVWLGGDLPPWSAGERLAALLPEPPAPPAEPLPRRRSARGRQPRRGRRLLVAAVALACLAGAGLALALPTRSQELAPAPADEIPVAPAEPDILLDAIAVPDPAPRMDPATTAPEPEPAPPPETVTVVVTVEAPAPAPAADTAPVLPAPDGAGDPAVPVLPLDAGPAPELPVAGG